MAKMRVNQIDISNANIFEVLLDNFPDMIHSVDDKGKIVYANKTAESLLGYSHKELLSMNIHELYADSVFNAVSEGFSDLKKNGGKIIPESLVKCKDGTEIPVEVRSFGIYDDNNIFIRTFFILRDMRNIKELKNKLIHAGRLAAIGELASGVAHDINNPLSIISMANEMALSEFEDINKLSNETLLLIKSQMKKVEKASNSIKKLVDHLRNFSRNADRENEVIDLHDILSNSLFIAGSKISKYNINIQNKVRRNRYFFTGSKNNMEQVFVNLITNACDAMAEKTHKNLKISICSCDRNGHNFWKCNISDTGTGIPYHIYENIFQSFVTTKKKGEGTGLGLSIARGIARDHYGDIEANNKKPNGAIFSVYIPQKKY